jgi:hypothetical protein
MRAIDERFPHEFRGWVENLKRLFLWRRAGYQIPRDELTFDQWTALATITRHYELKEQPAVVAVGAGSGGK